MRKRLACCVLFLCFCFSPVFAATETVGIMQEIYSQDFETSASDGFVLPGYVEKVEKGGSVMMGYGASDNPGSNKYTVVTVTEQDASDLFEISFDICAEGHPESKEQEFYLQLNPSALLLQVGLCSNAGNNLGIKLNTKTTKWTSAATDDFYTDTPVNVRILVDRASETVTGYINGENRGSYVFSEIGGNIADIKTTPVSVVRFYRYREHLETKFFLDDVVISNDVKVTYDPDSLSMDFTAKAEPMRENVVLNITGGTDSMYLGQEMELRLIPTAEEANVITVASVMAQKLSNGTAGFSFSQNIAIEPGWYYAEVVRKIGGIQKGSVKRQRIYLTSICDLLEMDAIAVAPKGNALNEDFKCVRKGPYGSQIEWEVLVNGSSDGRAAALFDQDGNYFPEIGSSAFYCTLQATLSYGGETLQIEREALSFRTPRYRLNGLLYRKPDGNVVRHPYPGSTIVGADIVKNPRVTTNDTLIVGVYEKERLKSISYAAVNESGIVPLNCEMGNDLANLETRIFLWNGMDNITTMPSSEPLYLPKISSPEKQREKNFFKKATAITDDGEDAGAILDSDLETEYRFAKTPEENTHGNSLGVLRSQPSDGVHSVSYMFSDGISGKLTFEYDFLVTEVTGEKGMLYLYDAEENIVLSLLLLGSTLQNQNTAKIYMNTSPYSWYTLRVEADTLEKTTDIFVNGELCYEDLEFRTPSDTIYRMQIYNSAGDASGIYLDDMMITDDSVTLLSDDFNEYEKGVLPEGWTVGGQYRQEIGIQEFTDEALSIFPQEIEIDVGRECELGGLDITFADGINVNYYLEASRDGKNYVRAISQMKELISGAISHDLGNVRARKLRLLIYKSVDADGNYCNAAIREIKLKTAENHSVENIAPKAYISVSSTASTSYDARGLTDGIMASFARLGEWICYRESNPMVTFSWDETQTVKEIEIFGRMTAGETTDGAIITFDDGTTVTVSDIPKNGLPKKVVLPSEKQVNWLSIQLKDIEKGNAGLSEVRILSQKEKTPVEYLTPWKTVSLASGYDGQWMVSDDLNNDGVVDFVSCRCVYEGMNHGVTAACAVDLNGTVLWTWGTQNLGTQTVGSDMACQIYDLDNDGKKEVLLSSKTQLFILNGETGEQKAVYDLPECENHKGEYANDCIIIADISGNGYPSDIIVKTRYTDAWAFTKDWEPIWHTCYPNGMKTGHYPRPIDIDNDGRDEVLAGFGFIDEDGSLISAFDQTEYHTAIRKGHVDSLAVLRYEKGMAKENMRFLITPCGAGNFFIVDGNGKKLWEEDTDIHYETLLPGKFTADGSELQILTNPTLNASEEQGGGGYSPAYIYHYDAETDTCTLHKELWGFQANRYLHGINYGGETDLIYAPSDNILTDENRNIRIQLVSDYRDAITSMRWDPQCGYHNDMDGDGTQDIVSLSLRNGTYHVTIYQNPNAPKTATKLGTGYNYTYY